MEAVPLAEAAMVSEVPLEVDLLVARAIIAAVHSVAEDKLDQFIKPNIYQRRDIPSDWDAPLLFLCDEYRYSFCDEYRHSLKDHPKR